MFYDSTGHSSVKMFSCHLHFAIPAVEFESLKCLATNVVQLEDTFCDDAVFTLCRHNSWYQERSIGGVFISVTKDEISADADLVLLATEQYEYGTPKFRELVSTYSQVLFHIYTKRYTVVDGAWLDESEFHVGDDRLVYKILTVDPLMYQFDENVDRYLNQRELLVCSCRHLAAMYYNLPISECKLSNEFVEQSRRSVCLLPALPVIPPIVLDVNLCHEKALADGLSTEEW